MFPPPDATREEHEHWLAVQGIPPGYDHATHGTVQDYIDSLASGDRKAYLDWALDLE